MRRLLAIGFVWLGCSLAWAVLGSTLGVRGGETSSALLADVHALWGPPLQQAPPSATGTETHREVQTETHFDDKLKRYYDVKKEVDVTTEAPLVLATSRIQAKLALEHRQKGLLWFPTYAVDFAGGYTFRNESAERRDATVRLPLRQDGVTYEGFEVVDGEGRPIDATFEEQQLRFGRTLAPGEAAAFTVRYRARGTGSWSYGTPGKGLGAEPGRARDFRLELETDFPEVDFPAGALSPTRHGAVTGGWRGTWESPQIVGTQVVGLELPQLLNPGPLAARITFFAPVSLLFFFFVVSILLAAANGALHPMHYFLVGCAFFAFHLLFAYLIDHVAVGPAFGISSAVAVLLVASYTRLFLPLRAALLRVALPQVVFLVLFSWTFFWKGFTGLAVTIGAVLTLFVVMQLTGRLDWEVVLGKGGRPAPAPGAP